MAKSPNTTPSSWSVRAEYNYKYPGWVESNPFVSSLLDMAEKAEWRKHKDMSVENELAWIDWVEKEFIQNMLTYPEAEAILNKIKKESK